MANITFMARDAKIRAFCKKYIESRIVHPSIDTQIRINTLIAHAIEKGEYRTIIPDRASQRAIEKYHYFYESLGYTFFEENGELYLSWEHNDVSL